MTNSSITPLRAIDLPANDDRSAVHMWFFSEENMHTYLCDNRYYAHESGTVRNSDNVSIGIWYYAEFSAKYPFESYNEELDAQMEAVIGQTDPSDECSPVNEWRKPVRNYTLDDYAAR